MKKSLPEKYPTELFPKTRGQSPDEAVKTISRDASHPVLQLQANIGNRATNALIESQRHRSHSQAIQINKTPSNETLIQRKVTVSGQEINSIFDCLISTEYYEKLTKIDRAKAISDYMLKNSKTWRFNEPNELLSYIQNVDSLTALIGSIFENGILSRVC